MPSLADFRAQTGDAYSDLNDRDLADGIYKKFYSDMPREQFDSKLGVAPEAAAAPDSRSFLEKAGSFVRNVYNNPPPTVAAARDVIKGAPAAATELTWGADPQAGERAAGTMLGAAAIASPTTPGLRAGEGVLARAVGSPEARAAPVRPLPPATPGEQVVEAGSRIGVDVPRYLATENTVVPKAAAGIKNAPFGGDPIANAETRMLEQMGAAREAIAPNARSPDLAGESARGGVTDWVRSGSKRPVSEAYQAVDTALTNPEARAPLNQTRAMVSDIMAERAHARIPGTSRAVERVLPAVQDKTGMDYQGAKMLRSFLGETTPQELVAQGINPVEAKRLYGALTKDLGSIITQAGGEGAHAVWREANTLARVTKENRAELTKLIGAKGDMSPEGVFNRLLNYAGSKSSADLNRLRLAKRTMGPAAWDEVGSAFIARMGRPPEGGFSADRFVTAFSNLSPQARSELFTPQQHAALNDLMTVSQRYKDLVSRNLNTSGTARGVLSGMFGGHLLADPVSAIGGMLGTRLAAEALSRPAVVRAAAQVARRAQSGNPVATRNALERLRDVAAREGLFNAVQEPPMRKFADGGRPYEDEPIVVGERGPELFVPDRPGTVLPADDPWARAAARTGHRGRAEGAGTKFVEGGYGVPSLYKMLDEGAQKAFESGGALQHYGEPYYDPAPVVQQAIGAAGGPLVAPAMEGAVLGAGAIRRAAIPQISKQALKEADTPLKLTVHPREAPYPQYAEAYPENVPGGVLKTDKKTGKQYLGKEDSPESAQFRKDREKIVADMKQGYEPYYDPAERSLVDPSNYPGRNVDTLTLQPAQQKTIDKYMKDIDAPITRERLRKAYEKGQELGNADNWYFMGQLEKDFVKELGEKEGRKQFLDKFASGMAATTSGQNPTGNLLMSQYLNYLEKRGLPMPTASHQIPSPVGGQYGMSNVADYMQMRERGGYTGLGADQPKMHNFARSFIGDLDRAVMDDQMAKGMLSHSADKNMANNARKQAFGLLEAPLHTEAAAAGVRPGAYQDVAWAGFKGEPGKPMISHINDAIERTHRLTGMSREEIVQRGLIRNEIPIYGYSAPIPAGGERRE